MPRLISSPQVRTLISSHLIVEPQDNGNSNCIRQSQIYKLVRTIGQGGFSKIKLVKHLPSGELVAMKEIAKDTLDDAERKRRFIREITFFKVLSHPNLIHLYEVIESATHYYFVIKYADGADLLTHINQQRRLREAEAKVLFGQILQCVSYLHQQHVTHRDLKPENILLVNNCTTAIVSDLGLATRYEQRVSLSTVCGSPHYASPEVIMGQPYSGERVDVWSLGVLLYVMVTGRLPFSGSTQEELYANIANVWYSFPVDLEVSAECKDLIEKTLVHDPQQRIALAEMKEHPFVKDVVACCDETHSDNDVEDHVDARVVERTIACLKEYGIETSEDEIKAKLDNNVFDQVTTCYKLLKQKVTKVACDKRSNAERHVTNGTNKDSKCNIIITNKSYRPTIKNKFKLSPSLSKTEVVDGACQKESKNGVLTIQDKTRRRNNNNLVNDSKTFQNPSSIKNYSNRIIQTESSTSNSKRNIHVIHQSSNAKTLATTSNAKERKTHRKDAQHKDNPKASKLIKSKMTYATAQNKKLASNLQYSRTPSKNLPNVEITTLSKKTAKDVLPPRTTIDLIETKRTKGYAYSKRQEVQSCSTKSIHNISPYKEKKPKMPSQQGKDGEGVFTSPRDNDDGDGDNDIVDCKVIDKLYSHRLILNTPTTNKMKNIKHGNGTNANESKLHLNQFKSSHYTSSFLDINVHNNSKLHSLQTITGFSIYNSHNRKQNGARQLSNNRPSKNNTFNSQDLQYEPKKHRVHKSPSIKQAINTSLKKHISHNTKNPFTPKKCLVTTNNAKTLYSNMKHKAKDKGEPKQKSNKRVNSPNGQINHENVFLMCTTKLDEDVIKRKVSEIAVDKGYVLTKLKDKHLQLATKTQDVINICVKLKNGSSWNNTVRFSHVKGDVTKTKEIVQSVLFGIGFD